MFLLKSFSTSAVNITPHEGLRLPTSTSIESPVEGVKIILSKDGIFLEDKKIIVLTNGSVDSNDVQAQDPDFIKQLFEALDKEAEKSKQIAKINEEHKFEGKLIMQADKSLPYGTLKKVMYTASMAGFADLKMAVISQE